MVIGNAKSELNVENSERKYDKKAAEDDIGITKNGAINVLVFL